MTDRELWQRIEGKPWAWPDLRYCDGGWWIGRTAISELVASALIRAACEDWLDASAAGWAISQHDEGHYCSSATLPIAVDPRPLHQFGDDRLEAMLNLCEAVASTRHGGDEKGGG